MAETVGLILLLLACIATTTALLVLLPFLIPQRVQRTRLVIQAMPGRAFVVGLANGLFFLILAALLAQGGEGGRLLSLIILLALAALAAIGLAAITTSLGQRIYAAEVQPGTGLREPVKTAVLLLLATLLPFVGWFVLAPLLLLLALGAAIISLVRRDGRAEKNTFPAPPAP